MKTLWDVAIRVSIITRLNELDSQKQAMWGQFNCQSMLAHLADSLKIPLGQLAVESKYLPLRYWPIKQLVIYWLPFPKNAPTAPELIARTGESIEIERQAIIRLINQLAERKGQQNWPEHPAFGRLKGATWGVQIYRHIDHHLKQFGV